MLVPEVAGNIARRGQLVRYAVLTGDGHIALALSKGAGDHRAGLVLTAWIDITAGICPVSQRDASPGCRPHCYDL